MKQNDLPKLENGINHTTSQPCGPCFQQTAGVNLNVNINNLRPLSATKKGIRGVLGPPRRSHICRQKVPNLTSEGSKLYLRSNYGFKKEENA